MLKKIAHTKWLYYFSYFMIFLILLVSRRYQQLLLPQVWHEDGTQVLRSFLEEGWWAFFETMNGYFILSSKIISYIALNISFFYFPMVSAILTFLFTVGIGLAVVLSPTYLRGKFLCGLMIFVVPIYPEVFGVTLYSFWWASILLFLLVLWDENKNFLAWRLVYLGIGGLSSPVIAIVLPLFCWRAWMFREKKSELIIAFFASIFAVVQIYEICKTHVTDVSHFDYIFLHAMPSYLGGYLIGNITSNPFWLWVAAFFLVGVLMLYFLRHGVIFTKGKDSVILILIYLWIALVVLNSQRIGFIEIHPNLMVGSRYFFLPFIILSWLLVQIFVNEMHRQFQQIIGCVFAVVILNSAYVWGAYHEDHEWANHVISCPNFDNYAINVVWAGQVVAPWYWTLPGAVCAKFLDHDALVSAKKLRGPIYPYVIHETGLNKANAKGKFIAGNIRNQVMLKLHRGDFILYQSGKTRNNENIIIQDYENVFISTLPLTNGFAYLSFTNKKLPDEFIIKMQGVMETKAPVTRTHYGPRKFLSSDPDD